MTLTEILNVLRRDKLTELIELGFNDINRPSDLDYVIDERLCNEFMNLCRILKDEHNRRLAIIYRDKLKRYFGIYRWDNWKTKRPELGLQWNSSYTNKLRRLMTKALTDDINYLNELKLNKDELEVIARYWNSSGMDFLPIDMIRELNKSINISDLIVLCKYKVDISWVIKNRELARKYDITDSDLCRNYDLINKLVTASTYDIVFSTISEVDKELTFY